MKRHRISTALSLLLLTALVPQARAAGDPNIDSGVGSAASRGPFGFNNTGRAPIYETPINTYGVYRDATGALVDAGNMPDNLMVRVPERTWEETHPAGPPMPTGAPGGLGGIGMGMASGLGAFGLGFPLGGGLGAIGSFTGVSPLAAAATAALTNGMPVGGGVGPGPAQFAGRTATGFAGAPPWMPQYPFTGNQYLGAGSGYVVNPQVKTSNVTLNGTSTTTTTWNTSYGPARYVQQVSGTGDNQVSTNTFFMNGHQYTSTTSNQPNPFPGSSIGTGQVGNGFYPITGSGAAGTPTVPGDIFSSTTTSPIDKPSANATQTTTFWSNTPNGNPLAPVGWGTGYDPHDFVHSGGGNANLGASFTTPLTDGSPQSVFWTNTPGAVGNFGESWTTPRTDGSPQSVFFGSSLGSTSIGGGFPNHAQEGTPQSAYVPNPDINNGMGIGGGNLGSVGYGLPGFGTPNVGGSYPGYGGPVSSNTFGAGGYPSGWTGTGEGGNGTGSGSGVGASLSGSYAGGGTPSTASDITSSSSNVGAGMQAGFGSQMNQDNTDDQTSDLNGTDNGTASVTGTLGGTHASVTNTGNGTTVGTRTAARNGSSGTVSRNSTLVTNTGNGTTVSAGADQSTANVGATGAGGNFGNNLGSGRSQTNRTQRRGINLDLNNGNLLNQRRIDRNDGTGNGGTRRIDNGDNAFGLFGGTPAAQRAFSNGLRGDMPYFGANTPTGWYGTGMHMRTARATQSMAAAGFGPNGNITTDLEPKLAAMHLSPSEAIGQITGSMRFANGDILTYGTNGTLRLASDNSGSITLNDGEILTFKQATPQVRAIALRSTLLF
jgi:hypothetical protein